MKKILAVSGGVDSMVMLDIMAKKFPTRELVVATFDHGTRETSREDTEFVSETAHALQIKIYRGEAKLGTETSEDEARAKRYDFLRKIAQKEGGEIYTAHHLDDLVESVAINLARGTGFRGLAVLNTPGTHRPFVDGALGEPWSKRDILKYAAENGVKFRQDPTNTSDRYLRNRLREKLANLSKETRLKIFELWKRQVEIGREIDEILDSIIPEDLKFERGWFLVLDDNVALEILKAGLIKAEVPATRPQIREFLKAIREYEPGKKFNLPEDRLVKIGRDEFALKNMVK